MKSKNLWGRLQWNWRSRAFEKAIEIGMRRRWQCSWHGMWWGGREGKKTEEDEKPKKVLQGGVFISIQFWTLVIFFQTLKKLILETSQVRISSQMDICIPMIVLRCWGQDKDGRYLTTQDVPCGRGGTLTWWQKREFFLTLWGPLNAHLWSVYSFKLYTCDFTLWTNFSLVRPLFTFGLNLKKKIKI